MVVQNVRKDLVCLALAIHNLVVPLEFRRPNHLQLLTIYALLML